MLLGTLAAREDEKAFFQSKYLQLLYDSSSCKIWVSDTHPQAQDNLFSPGVFVLKQ